MSNRKISLAASILKDDADLTPAAILNLEKILSQVDPNVNTSTYRPYFQDLDYADDRKTAKGFLNTDITCMDDIQSIRLAVLYATANHPGSDNGLQTIIICDSVNTQKSLEQQIIYANGNIIINNIQEIREPSELQLINAEIIQTRTPAGTIVCHSINQIDYPRHVTTIKLNPELSINLVSAGIDTTKNNSVQLLV